MPDRGTTTLLPSRPLRFPMGRVGSAILVCVLAAALLVRAAYLNVVIGTGSRADVRTLCPEEVSFRGGPAVSPYLVRLHNRAFTPEPRLLLGDLGALGTASRVHFLLQVCHLPSAGERSALSSQGIELLAYLAGNTYIASSESADTDRVGEMANVRFAGPIDPADKVSLPLARRDIGPWADAGNGRAAITVQLHQDVDPAVGLRLMQEFGAEGIVLIPAIPAVSGVVSLDRVDGLARQDEVQFVSLLDLPLEEHNDGARPASNVATINAAPYGLTGAGVTVLVYDSGLADTAHPDFGARIIELEAGETVRSHSTHV